MEPKTMYRCTGSCQGVTNEAGKNCAAESCDKFNQPLEACTQCGGCTAATEQDELPHACGGCQAA